MRKSVVPAVDGHPLACAELGDDAGYRCAQRHARLRFAVALDRGDLRLRVMPSSNEPLARGALERFHVGPGEALHREVLGLRARPLRKQDLHERIARRAPGRAARARRAAR